MSAVFGSSKNRMLCESISDHPDIGGAVGDFVGGDESPFFSPSHAPNALAIIIMQRNVLALVLSRISLIKILKIDFQSASPKSEGWTWMKIKLLNLSHQHQVTL
ncbi:hypothetical protein J2785_007433 [Burkholderia ambifaria]|nr:hypothetical protein [Burkholderia ambifaria]MDR6504235.1 hypothetical protein [Burkholderia ambifaria]